MVRKGVAWERWTPTPKTEAAEAEREVGKATAQDAA
jgi:hypothetical protein